jgi:hypothetical protein
LGRGGAGGVVVLAEGATLGEKWGYVVAGGLWWCAGVQWAVLQEVGSAHFLLEFPCSFFFEASDLTMVRLFS